MIDRERPPPLSPSTMDRLKHPWNVVLVSTSYLETFGCHARMFASTPKKSSRSLTITDPRWKPTTTGVRYGVAEICSRKPRRRQLEAWSPALA